MSKVNKLSEILNTIKNIVYTYENLEKASDRAKEASAKIAEQQPSKENAPLYTDSDIRATLDQHKEAMDNIKKQLAQYSELSEGLKDLPADHPARKSLNEANAKMRADMLRLQSDASVNAWEKHLANKAARKEDAHYQNLKSERDALQRHADKLQSINDQYKDMKLPAPKYHADNRDITHKRLNEVNTDLKEIQDRREAAGNAVRAATAAEREKKEKNKNMLSGVKSAIKSTDLSPADTSHTTGAVSGPKNTTEMLSAADTKQQHYNDIHSKYADDYLKLASKADSKVAQSKSQLDAVKQTMGHLLNHAQDPSYKDKLRQQADAMPEGDEKHNTLKIAATLDRLPHSNFEAIEDAMSKLHDHHDRIASELAGHLSQASDMKQKAGTPKQVESMPVPAGHFRKFVEGMRGSGYKDERPVEQTVRPSTGLHGDAAGKLGSAAEIEWSKQKGQAADKKAATEATKPLEQAAIRIPKDPSKE